MKLNKMYEEVLLEFLLKEIKTYRYRLKKEMPEISSYTYEFNTSENEYEVSFSGPMMSDDEPYFYVSFGPIGGTRDTVTNENVVFRVIHTVGEIAKEVFAKYGEDIKGFVFDTSKKDKSKTTRDSQRGKFYLRFIKRQFPQARVSKIQGDLIKVDIDK